MRLLRVITPRETIKYNIIDVDADVLVDYFYTIDTESKRVKFTDVKGYITDENGKFKYWELSYTKKLLMIHMILNSPLASESLYFLHKDEE